eukprot:5975299-Prymnesium_polylepis.1
MKNALIIWVNRTAGCEVEQQDSKIAAAASEVRRSGQRSSGGTLLLHGECMRATLFTAPCSRLSVSPAR